MNKWSRIALTSTVALALATPAFAQSTTPTPEAAPKTEQSMPQSSDTQSSGTQAPDTKAPDTGSQASTTTSTSASGEVIAEQQDGQTLSSDIIGMKVVGANDESLGEVSELIIEDTQITGAVLSVGGVLGLGAKKVGVPWDALSMSDQEGSPVAMVSLSKEQLSDMPEFKTLADVKAEQQRQMQSNTSGTTGTTGTGGSSTGGGTSTQ